MRQGRERARGWGEGVVASASVSTSASQSQKEKQRVKGYRYDCDEGVECADKSDELLRGLSNTNSEYLQLRGAERLARFANTKAVWPLMDVDQFAVVMKLKQKRMDVQIAQNKLIKILNFIEKLGDSEFRDVRK